MNDYDSTSDTQDHIKRVRDLLEDMIVTLTFRSAAHDKSKFDPIEKEVFDRMTPKLKASTYGSEEYKGFLSDMQVALRHHYAQNSHHPEHYGYSECNGCFKHHPIDYDKQCDVCGYGQFTLRGDVSKMTLLDVLEMLCDWKAASERHAKGSIHSSIDINEKRFEISPQLAQILRNTAKEMCW